MESQKKNVAAQKKRKIFTKVKEAKKARQTGVIYIGHLPYGFVEEGLKGYFGQYGDVLRVKIMRSKKTGRSKGYGFLEFRDAEVAEVAAESMNGYLMYGTPLEARKLEDAEVHEGLFKGSGKKFKFVPWQLIHRNSVNNPKRTEEQVRKAVQAMLRKDAEKKAKIAQLGLKYSFTGYAEL